MSLLQRMERAQKAKEAAEAAKNGSAAPEASERRRPDPARNRRRANGHHARPRSPRTVTRRAVASRALLGSGERRSRPSPSGLMRAAPTPVREELIREVRLRLQTEVVGAFKSLLDAKDGRSGADRGPGRSRDRPERVRRHARGARAPRRRWSTTSPASGRWSRCSPTRPSPRSWSTDRTTSTSSGGGKIQRIDSVFLNDEHVLRVIDRIITPLGRRIDESSPRVDARLPDGSRVNAVIEPLSLIGPVITVRKFSKTPYTVDDLVRFGPRRPTCSSSSGRASRPAQPLRLRRHRLGQDDDAQRALVVHPGDERIVTIEDAAELQLRQDHVITLSRARRTSRAKARSRSGTCSATPCTCAPTGSSSASAGPARRWTCSRP